MNYLVQTLKVLLIIQLNQCSLLTKTKIEQQSSHRRILTNQIAENFEQQLDSPNKFRLAVFNAENQSKNDFLWLWELREEGSTFNMIEAYKSLFHENDNEVYLYDEPLSFEVLAFIRQNFKGQQGNYFEVNNKNSETEVYSGQVSFGMPGLNSEDNQNKKDYIDGIINHNTDLSQRLIQYKNELKTQLEEQQQEFANKELTDDENQVFEQNKLILKQINDGPEDEKFFPYIFTSKYSIENPDYEKQIEKSYRITNNFSIKPQLKKELIERLFQEYEKQTKKIKEKLKEKEKLKDQLKEIEIEKLKDEFLGVLSTLIMDLERIHPYQDFNCRSFAVLMLNKELIRQQMSPSIVEDPNSFDFLTKEKAIEYIKQGQKNYQQLRSEQKIHENDPDNKTMIENVVVLQNIESVLCEKNNESQDQDNEVKPQKQGQNNEVEVQDQDDEEDEEDEEKKILDMPVSLIKQFKDTLDNSNEISEFKEKIKEILMNYSFYKEIIQTFPQGQQSFNVKEIIENVINKSLTCPEGYSEYNNIEKVKEQAEPIYQKALENPLFKTWLKLNESNGDDK